MQLFEKSEPNYYAIIPANVRYDPELCANSKLLYGEISALCNKKGYCWSNNEYFSNLYNVSKTSISRWISNLVDRGYIKTELIYKEGSKEIVHRYLSLCQYPIDKNVNTPIDKIEVSPIPKNGKDNNTSFNNTVINNTVNTTKLYEDFLFVLNLILNKRYLGCSKSKKGFPVRIKEGRTLADFKNAINNASLDPFHIENGFKYLTPEFFTRSDKLDKFMQQVVIPVTAAQKTNYDHFQSISQELTQRIDSIPNDVYEQFKQQYTPGL